MNHFSLKVLLVEDNEENYLLIRTLFSEIPSAQFHLERIAYSEELANVTQHYDVYLIKYQPGQPLKLMLPTAIASRPVPVILLAEQGSREIEIVTMQAGAADYLVRSDLTAARLERSIHYAIQRYHTLEQLHQAIWEKRMLSLAINNITTGVVITDPGQPDNPIIFINSAFTQITGYSTSDVLGKNCRFLQGVDTDLLIVQQIAEAIDQQRSITCTLINYRRDGTPFWNELTINPVFDATGNLLNFIGLQTDITVRMQAEAALRESEERYALAMLGANDGIWDWNLKTGEVYYSPRWKAMLGCIDYEIKNTLDDWFLRVHPEDLYWVKRELTAHLNGHTPHFESEHRMRHNDGSFHWMLSRGLAVRDASGQVTRVAGSQTDVTARKQAEERLIHDALYDTLTGLPNRVLLMERLRHAVQLAQRSSDYLFAMLFIDLDRFKVINDSLGHMMGDQLLIAIAQRLLNCLRPSDTIARLGGDEFVILLEDVKDTDTVTLVADRIQHELSIPFWLGGHEVFTAASIGIALSITGYDRPEDLLRDADTAMYRAKAQGRGRYEIFHPGMHTHAVALLQLETDLRRAIERSELLLHYQPIVSLRTRQIVGFEALLRWQHSKRGLISPAEFIPVAEETGLIVPIGWWVLQTACQQMKQWQEQFPNQAMLTINVNLSGKQFTPQLTQQVRQILKETGLEPRCLKLEITESLLMENADYAVSTLTELQKLGISLAIDDFGTGYSSLSYLHRFPIDTLKVDRSFISKIDVDGEQLAIVRTIMTLAWNLGMEVVAEGVETVKQLAQLGALHCEQAQGYLFSKPVNSEAAEQLITGALDNEHLKSLLN